MADKDNRLKPIRLPISVEDALRGAMEVAPPDKPKKRKKKVRRKKAQ